MDADMAGGLRFEMFVALRYLRARRKIAVISVITGLSVLGIAAGVMGVMSAYSKGAPVRVIGAETTGAGDLYWYVKADSPIKTLKDTDGKVLAYYMPVTKELVGWNANDIKETQGEALNFPLLADADRKVASLYDMIQGEKVKTYVENGIIEVAPLAFMRGRTLDHAFVILDEAQNTTEPQMKMFLTRMGQNAQFVVTGDLTQIDLPAKQKSGLPQALKLLESVSEAKIVFLNAQDVVRHPLVKKIIDRYDHS